MSAMVFPRPERPSPAIRCAFVEHVAGLPPKVLAAVKRAGLRKMSEASAAQRAGSPR